MTARLRYLVALVALLWAAGAAAGSGCDRRFAAGRADGAAVYAEACARCHGHDGVPAPERALQLGVPDLGGPEIQQHSDTELRDRIYHGSPRKGMPAFQGALTDEQLIAVVEHLRTLRRDLAEPGSSR